MEAIHLMLTFAYWIFKRSKSSESQINSVFHEWKSRK